MSGLASGKKTAGTLTTAEWKRANAMRHIYKIIAAAGFLIFWGHHSAHATCCASEITEEEVAWQYMDEVENEGQCQCQYGEYVRTGTLVTFWEPIRIIETVKDPYCMMTAGEDQGDATDLNGGTHSDTGAQEDHSVFQQVHIVLPDYIMESITEIDNRCWHSSMGNPMDYISEDDPAWNDDTIAAATYPLTDMAADYDMQMTCEADAIASQLGVPVDFLFWCMGAWGSAFPMSGHVNNDEYVTGNISTAARAIYIGGRLGYIFDAASYYCYAGPMPLWIKSYFKLQPVRPTNNELLVPIGLSSAIWDTGLNVTEDCGDNFAWVLWRKRWCCDSQGGQNFNTQH
jgi:conjugal transfer pilus assembly protein TraU